MKRIVFLIGLILVLSSTFVYGQENTVEAKSGEKETDWVNKYGDAFNKGDFQGMLEAGGHVRYQKIDDASLERLLKIAKDKTKTKEDDIQIRCMTIEILGYLKLKNEKVFEQLKNIAEDKDELLTIRKFAFQQMGGAGKDEKIFNYLISKLNDPNPDIREAAISRLGEPGNIKAGVYLMPFLSEGDAKIKNAAIVSLGTIGYKEATDVIIKNLYDEETIGSAIFALQKMHDEKAIEPLIGILLDKNKTDSVYFMVTRALADYKDERVADALIKVLNEGGFRSINAAEALGEMGNLRATEAIKNAIVKETDPFALKKYKEAYKKITGKDYVGQK